jgi:hypothetical protein
MSNLYILQTLEWLCNGNSMNITSNMSKKNCCISLLLYWQNDLVTKLSGQWSHLWWEYGDSDIAGKALLVHLTNKHVMDLLARMITQFNPIYWIVF